MASPKLKVKVEVGANVKGALSGFRRVSAGLRGMGRAAAGAARGVGIAGGVIGGAALAAGAATFKMAESQAAYNDKLTKAAQIVKITANSYAQLQNAAVLAGLSSEEFDKGIQKFTRSIGEAKLGTGALYTTLKKGSPALLEQVLAAKDSESAFYLMAEAMDTLQSQSDKAALGAAAFGRAGIKMTLLTKGGTAEIDKQRARFLKYYGVLNDDVLKASEEFGDSQLDLSDALAGTKAAIGNGLIPILQPMIANLAEVVTKNREIIATKVGEVFRGIGEWMAKIDWQTTIDSVFSMTTRVGELGAGFIKFASDAGRALQPFIAIVSGLARQIDQLGDSLDVLGILDDRETRFTGDAATRARVMADKARLAGGGPQAPVPTMMQRKIGSGIDLSRGVAQLQTQAVGGKIEIVVKSDPGLATRTESITSTNAAVPIKASNTGRRSTGSGRP